MPGSDVAFKDFNVRIGYQKDEKSPYRHLWIQPTSSDDAPVNGIFVLFTDERPPEAGLGYYNPGNKWVVGFALNRDFDSMYELLRSEKGLLFRWWADDQNKMVWFQITGNHGAKNKFLRNAEELLREQRVPTLAERPDK
jgi:hypothetical protein